jgi:hypothetical protein
MSNPPTPIEETKVPKSTVDEQRFESTVSFQCPKCDEHIRTTVAVAEPDWGSMEGFSDVNSENDAELQCTRCQSSFDVHVITAGAQCEVTLSEHPDVAVDADSPMYSPDPTSWIGDIPDQPFDIFWTSKEAVIELLSKHGGDEGHEVLNRMAFAQLFSALEAFLSDTLLKTVANDPEAMMRVVVWDTSLKELKFTAEELLSEPNVVKNAVLKHLKEVNYHRLPYVDGLYKAALKTSILPTDSEKRKQLITAVGYRHDCVHRNGVDRDGKRLDIFTKAYVGVVANIMYSVVDAIDDAVDPWDATVSSNADSSMDDEIAF